MDRPWPFGGPPRRDGFPRTSPLPPVAGAKRRRPPRSPTPRDAQFHTLVENSDEGMLLVDGTGVIRYANAVAERYLGHPPAELVGRLGFDLCVSDDVAYAQAVFGRCLEQPDVAIPATIKTPDPTCGFPWLAVKLVNRLDTPGVRAIEVHFHGSGIGREALEARRRQAEKMEAVGRMTAGVAHDFNNVLSVIMANASLIAASLDPEDAETRTELAELRGAARRGATMIAKLLGFSRNVSLDVVPTDLSAVARGAESMLRQVIPEHVALDIEIAPACIALCDVVAVEQILLNLATNARDATLTSGGVRVIVTPEHVDGADTRRPAWLSPGDFIRISVEDGGDGMDAETRTRALEPFFTTKPPGVGSGLGLSMVYGLMKQQNGFLDLESAPGRGTTVHLYFPRTTEIPRAQPTAPTHTVPTRTGATILLIEDDASLRRTGQRVLHYLGYRVLIAEDGSNGIALFEAHAGEIDLVMSDMMMPGLSGADVYRAIRDRNPSVPFLLSSGYQDRPGKTFLVPRGVRVIPKPWAIEDVGHAVRQALNAAP